MSRCAHGAPPVKCWRNSAAVIEPGSAGGVGGVSRHLLQQRLVLVEQWQPPQRLARDGARLLEPLGQLVVVREQRPEGQAQGHLARTGQGRDVDDRGCVGVPGGIRERVSQDKPPLGVGVADEAGASAVVRDHVAWLHRRRAERVLRRRQQPGDLDRHLEVAQRPHNGDHHAGACHVALHGHHRVARLDGDPAAVERDALADDDEVRRVPADLLRRVVQPDEARLVCRPGADREDAAESVGGQPLLVPDSDVELGAVGRLSSPLLEPLRTLLVRRGEGERARPPRRPRPGHGLVDDPAPRRTRRGVGGRDIGEDDDWRLW